LSKLSAFLWFGGDDSDKDDENNNKKQAQQSNNNINSNATAIAASLASISNVMDAKLGSFKASQRVGGDKTGAALADLANTVVEASSDNGKVKVTMTGQQVPVSVQIDESYFQELCSGGKGGNNQNNKDAATATAAAVQELNLQITTAMKSAHDKSGQKLQDKLKVLYQDLGFS
jgi:YbaB/EbfC DNA-binding family